VFAGFPREIRPIGRILSIRRVRELRHQIANEAAELYSQRPGKPGRSLKIKRFGRKKRRAKTTGHDCQKVEFAKPSNLGYS